MKGRPSTASQNIFWMILCGCCVSAEITDHVHDGTDQAVNLMVGFEEVNPLTIVAW